MRPRASVSPIPNSISAVRRLVDVERAYFCGGQQDAAGVNLADIETTDLGLVQVEDPGLGVEGTEIEDRSPRSIQFRARCRPPVLGSQRDLARTRIELDSDPVATASLSVKTRLPSSVQR